MSESHRVGLCRGSATDLCSRVDRFESRPGHRLFWLGFFVTSVIRSWKIPGYYYHDYNTFASFQILSNSSFSSHSNIWFYTLRDSGSVVTYEYTTVNETTNACSCTSLNEFKFLSNLLSSWRTFSGRMMNSFRQSYCSKITYVDQNYWDFGICLSSGILQYRKQSFGNWISQVRGRDTYSIGYLWKSKPQSLVHKLSNSASYTPSSLYFT
jgi:hypothetical protein